jgi:hypothetical protein
MKPVPPCPQIPPELQQQAADAEQRKDRALERLTEKLAEAPTHVRDDFEQAMVDLIDADKRAVLAIGNHRSRK